MLKSGRLSLYVDPLARRPLKVHLGPNITGRPVGSQLQLYLFPDWQLSDGDRGSC